MTFLSKVFIAFKFMFYVLGSGKNLKAKLDGNKVKVRPVIN